MTKAIKYLKTNKIDFSILKYAHDSKIKSYGKEAVMSLGLDESVVFKTLILNSDELKKHVVVVIPVNKIVDMKKMAKLLDVKKIDMMDSAKSENITGYIIGAISPIAQKNVGITFIDSSAYSFDKIYISAGKRGVEIGINAKDFIDITNAKIL